MQPRIPMPLAHRAFGVFEDVYEGRATTILPATGAQVAHDPDTALFTAVRPTAVEPMAVAAMQTLAEFCEVGNLADACTPPCKFDVPLSMWDGPCTGTHQQPARH